VRNYPAFLREATRILHPGGLLLLVELDYQPVADGRRAPYWQGLGGDGVLAASGAPGWFALWDAYLRSLLALGFDVSVPRRLGQLLQETKADIPSRTHAQQADIPIGFCHRGMRACHFISRKPYGLTF
jgi:ubiquinone/menaquinone biosynthesis C-methylase UbiE